MSLNDALGPKPPKPADPVKIVVTRDERPGPSEENRMLKNVAARLKPMGATHVASYCVHVYKRELSLDIELRAQIVEDCGAPAHMALKPVEANASLQQLAMDVAKRFGWTPDKKTRKTIIER